MFLAVPMFTRAVMLPQFQKYWFSRRDSPVVGIPGHTWLKGLFIFRSKNEQFPPGIKPCPHPSDYVRLPQICKGVGACDDEEPAAISTEEYNHSLQCYTGRAVSVFGVTSKCTILSKQLFAQVYYACAKIPLDYFQTSQS